MPAPTTQTSADLYKAAVAHFQSDRLAEAEIGFRQLIARFPDHPGANYSLAVVLRAQGRLRDATAQYRRTIVLSPDNAKAYNNLGVILAIQKHVGEAEAQYKKALALQPDYANAHYNYANLLRGKPEVPRAIFHYRRALAGKPDDPDTHNNLGVALALDGQSNEAIRCYRRALALRPGYAEALSNLGAALDSEGQVDEGLACLLQALELDPAFADAHYNLARVLQENGRSDEAEAHYRRAVALDPEHAEAHGNLGLLVQHQGRMDEALARYERAQALKPNYADAHWNEALARLALGDFAIGWRKYEWRWRRRETPPRSLAAPLWDGSRLSGRTILLHAEQGQGDAIQFIRFAPLVKACGGEVIVEAPLSLQRLFTGVAGIDRLVPAGAALPPHDVHAPLLSLPGLLDVSLDTIPGQTPYLSADADLIQNWRERLSRLSGRKVGLVWRGAPAHGDDRNRSMSASVMAALVTGTPIHCVILQKDARPEEIAAFGDGVSYETGPLLADWSDTAAAIQAIDLVITVDTAVAHLAGALGKAAWVLLPFAADWRWLLERSDSPWYPSLHLFRQPTPGDWAAVSRDVRAALDTADPPPRRILPCEAGEGDRPGLDSGGWRGPPSHVAPVLPPSPRFTWSPPPASQGETIRAPRAGTPGRPPAMVVSHERSGTHFLMNALAYGYDYTAQPWRDLDSHNRDMDLSGASQIATSLLAHAADPLSRLVKSHHAVEVFAGELERITEAYLVFYVYREPAPVFVSFWRHLRALDWDEGPRLADPLALARAQPSGHLMRYQTRRHATMLLRWAAHVQGWLAAAEAGARIIPVRYEDLDRDPEQTLAAVSGAIGRAPAAPFLRPPRDVNVIAAAREKAPAPVSPAVWTSLRAHCRAELAPMLDRLGY